MNTADESAQNSTFPMLKIPSMCRVVVYLRLRTKTQWEWIEFFMFYQYSAKRIALFSLPHTHAQRRLFRELCKLHVCIRTLKKHFMQFFYLAKLYISANYTTTTSPQRTPPPRYPSRQFFFLRLQQQIFLLCRAFQLLEKRGERYCWHWEAKEFCMHNAKCGYISALWSLWSTPHQLICVIIELQWSICWEARLGLGHGLWRGDNLLGKHGGSTLSQHAWFTGIFRHKKPSSDRSSRALHSRIASSRCVNNQEDGCFCCVRRRLSKKERDGRRSREIQEVNEAKSGVAAASRTSRGDVHVHWVISNRFKTFVQNCKHFVVFVRQFLQTTRSHICEVDVFAQDSLFYMPVGHFLCLRRRGYPLTSLSCGCRDEREFVHHTRGRLSCGVMTLEMNICFIPECNVRIILCRNYVCGSESRFCVFIKYFFTVVTPFHRRQEQSSPRRRVIMNFYNIFVVSGTFW